MEPGTIRPPIAAQRAHELTIHGDTRQDPYYWLKEREDAQVIDYLNAENTYLDEQLAHTRDFQEQLFLEMKARIQEKDESAPVYKNGYYYYTRTEEGQEYYKYCRRKGSLDAPEELLLDVDALAKGHTYYAATGFSVSPDNRLLAYGVDTVSRREYTIHIKNLETGEVYADRLYPTTGGAVWAADNATLFYTVKNPQTLLTERIRRHRLGTDAALDEDVYVETDPTNYIGVSKTRSGQYIVLHSSATLSSECRLLRADEPDGVFRVFQPRMPEVLYDIDHHEDRFFVTTNWQAQNFRLMETPVTATTSEHWQEVVAHRADVLLEGVEVFREHLVLSERANGLAQLRIRHLATNEEHYLDFGEPAYTAYTAGNPEYDTNNLRYQYTSLTTPHSVYDYDMQTRVKTLRKRQVVVGGYEPAAYVTERLHATAADGTKVPISIVYRKGFKKDGQGALLLYGYGSYGHSLDASFSSNRLSLLDRGFAYAIAHVRGGQEMGRAWYDNGRTNHKMNTFTDFIACAEHLVAQGYTSPAHLYANGGSAGGLLMGVIVNLRPELWNGVVADVPFVDVVTTMLDESIPLTTNEFDEWGNPQNEESYRYMKSYSPYDNVAAKAYPNLLVTTGLHDSQVQYWEPAKWVARLRALKTDSNLLVLHTNMEAGHGGASGRFAYLKDVALMYAFVLNLEGIHV